MNMRQNSLAAPTSENGWHGELPPGWTTLPVRRALLPRTGRNDVLGREAYLSLVSGTGIVPYEEKGDIGNKKSDDLSNCKLVEPGDFVINSMNFLIGGFGRSDYQGVCSSVYIVAVPNETDFEPRFLMRIFQVREFQRHVGRLGKGIMALRMAIGWDELKNQPVPAPPLHEQRRIADFLDVQTSRIDALIRKKEQLLERLVELQRAHLGAEISAQVMAKGTFQLRYALASLTQGWSPVAENASATDNAWGVLKLSAIKDGHYVPWENKELSEGTAVPIDLRIRAGDVLITRANTPRLVGAAALVEDDSYNLIPSDLIYTLRLNADRLIPKFLLYFLLSPQVRAVFEVEARGSSQTMVKLSQEHIRSLQVPALSVAEQAAVVTKLNAKFDKLLSLRSHVESHLVRLREYRESLIAAAVTGQLDINSYKEAA